MKGCEKKIDLVKGQICKKNQSNSPLRLHYWPKGGKCISNHFFSLKMSPFHIIRTLFIFPLHYPVRPSLIFVLQSASNHFPICVIKDSEENRLVGKFGLNLVWWKCMNFWKVSEQINLQSLEGAYAGYTSQTYTLQKYTWRLWFPKCNSLKTVGHSFQKIYHILWSTTAL